MSEWLRSQCYWFGKWQSPRDNRLASGRGVVAAREWESLCSPIYHCPMWTSWAAKQEVWAKGGGCRREGGSQWAWLTRLLPLCPALSSAQEVTAPTEQTSQPPGLDHYPRPLSFQMKGQYWFSVVTSPGKMHHSGHFPTEYSKSTFERISLLNSLKLANLGVLCQSPDSDSLTHTVKASILKSTSSGRGVCPSLAGHPAGEADTPRASWESLQWAGPR